MRCHPCGRIPAIICRNDSGILIVTENTYADEEYRFEGQIPRNVLETLGNGKPISKLWWAKRPRLTVNEARRLLGLRVYDLTLWTTVTRPAMRQVVRIPELKSLTVLGISGPGRIRDFQRAQTLERFNCSWLKEQDLLEVAKCETLSELSVQSSVLNQSVLSAILALPRLHQLDLEGSNLDDAMIRRISQSTTITSLEIGGTGLTREGLKHLLRMQQLRGLDLWATKLSNQDLRLLPELPNLEYLSLGEYDHLHAFNAATVMDVLLAIPSLKRVWLDGVRLDATQKALLEGRLESLRLTVAD
jgi:hypothetical protein